MPVPAPVTIATLSKRRPVMGISWEGNKRSHGEVGHAVAVREHNGPHSRRFLCRLDLTDR
jgi:hypothetical protein